jgi:hypothetical protein
LRLAKEKTAKLAGEQSPPLRRIVYIAPFAAASNALPGGVFIADIAAAKNDFARLQFSLELIVEDWKPILNTGDRLGAALGA